MKEKPTSISTDFYKDIEEKLGRKLTPEEVAGLGGAPTPVYTQPVDDEIDTIERM